LLLHLPPLSTLFPYTTLFRSLVVAIIFLFLRDWRTTFIPVVTIPISLIGVFFIMYLMDFSINVLTLLGIVLSIGLVVDDAIVVLDRKSTRLNSSHVKISYAVF